MSIQELFDFMYRELQGCNGYPFIDRALADLRKSMENRDNFSPERFKRWFIDKSVIYKNSPLAFLTKCGLEDVEKGAFDRVVVKSFDLLPLCEDMQQRGIAYSPKDTLYLDTYLLHIYNNDLMTIDELGSWLHTAISLIERHSKNAEEFKELFKKSQSMKRLNLPYAELDEKVEKENAEIEEMINELEEENSAKKVRQNEEENKTNNQTT